MTDRPAWYAGVPPASVDVPGALGGGRHRLTWRSGALVAEDHADADAERALEALGGGRCPCLDLLDSWDAHARDPVVLSVGSRGPADRVRLDPVELQRLVDGTVAQWRREVSTARTYVTTTAARTALDREEAAAEGPVVSAEAALRRRIDFLRLFTLPPGLQHRLALTVAAHAVDAWDDGSFRTAHGARVAAALVARAGAALREALRAGGAGAGAFAVDVEVLPTRGAPDVVVGAGARPLVTARLAVDWLAAVWGRAVVTAGSALVLDVVAVEDDGGPLLEVVTVELPPTAGGPQARATRKVAVESGVGG